MRRTTRRIATFATIAAAVLAAATGCSSNDAGGDSGLEKSTVDIGLTGIGAISNVPLYLADSLGYFADEGLTVNLTALKGGTTAIQALITDTVDATTNEYIHTIAAQQEGKGIQAIEVISYAPTYALVTTEGNFDARVSDLQDMKIGVVSLGGSTEDLVTYVFTTNDLDPAAAQLIAIGAGASQTAAVNGGELDALIATEPTLTTALNDGLVEPLVDFRNPAVIDDIFGGPAPFWSLLVTDAFTEENPRTAQALVSATERALAYIEDHTAAEVTDQLPADIFFPSGDRELFEDILSAASQSFSTDGSMPEGGPERIADYLKAAHPDVDLDDVDLEATYDDSFVTATH